MNEEFTTKDIKEKSVSAEEEKMDEDLDERVFALTHKAKSTVIDGLGVIEEGKPGALVGVYYGWTALRNPYEFIHEMAAYFGGEVRFATLDREMPPGFVCKMQLSRPFLRELSTDTKNFKKIQINLLEIRASKPRAELILYQDTAAMLWRYKPIIPVSYKEQ